MYGKIFESIYDGSLAENWKTMIVFQQLIILANEDGIVDMTREAIARRTNIPFEVINEGITELEKPDPHSRSDLENGRRLIPTDPQRNWGWKLVNHSYYRNLAKRVDKLEADRVRIAEKRKKIKDVAHSRKTSQKVENNRLSDTYSYADKTYTPNFEKCWSHYPRKIEKKKAFKAYQTRIKQGVSPKDLLKATINYAKACQVKEKDYIKHGATFYGPNEPYKDWIEGNPEDKKGWV